MVKAVLIDLSGTLHIDDVAIPGAQEALKKLRSTGVTIKFVTNTTKDSKETLYNRLKGLKFEIEQDQIFSSLASAKNLIDKSKLKPLLLLTEDAKKDFKDVIPKNDAEIDAVVVGLAPDSFQYERLNEAFRHLLNGAKLIGIHEGKFYARKDGLALGPGCFIKGLEYSAECKAEVVGKPTEKFFTEALDGIAPKDAVMIGDDVTDDVKGAMDAGLKGILVETGKYRDGDETKISPPPTAVCPCFVHAVDLIINKMLTD